MKKLGMAFVALFSFVVLANESVQPPTNTNPNANSPTLENNEISAPAPETKSPTKEKLAKRPKKHHHSEHEKTN